LKRALLSLVLCFSAVSALRADDAAASTAASAPTEAAAVADAVSSNAGQRKVSAGKAYGANTFAGMLVGSAVGAAAGAIPYAVDRKSQDPTSVILGAVYGAVGGAVGLGLPLSAYEVASDKPGAGITVLYNTLGFAVLGGAVGGGAGMISYRRKISYDPNSAEDFLGAAAGGVCGGALLGFGVGIVEGVFWQGRGMRVPGKGIHAKAGILELATVHDDGISLSALPNATLLKVDF
jgi:hypothetical protein